MRFAVVALLAGCNAILGVHTFEPPVATPAQWVSVAGATAHSCAIESDGSLWCWGHNVHGELGLGDGAAPDVTTPARVAGTGWSTIAAGDAHTCGLRDDETLWCWGRNDHGQLGDGSQVDRNAPGQVGTDHWLALATGAAHTCAIRDDHHLWCWGAGAHNQIGDGNAVDHLRPTPVLEPMTWIQIGAGGGHSCAIASDEQVWCWGDNRSGQVGGAGAEVPSPLVVGEQASAIALGLDFTCALHGTIACWGNNFVGQLGDATSKSHSTPGLIASSRTDECCSATSRSTFAFCAVILLSRSFK